MNRTEAEARVLEAADQLFYTRGLHSVAMKDIRDASGVALKRLYQCFPSKDALVTAYLDNRDRTWRADLRDFVCSQTTDPRERLLLVFDSLEGWFHDPHFRGCAYINAFGELGGTRPLIARIAHDHKTALRTFLEELLRDASVDDAATVAEQLMILIDGAIAAAAIHEGPIAARHARALAARLLDAAA